MSKCDYCRRSDYAKHPCLSGDGSSKPDILLVGEAPGEVEDKIGRVFAGPTGNFFRSSIARFSQTYKKKHGRKPKVRYTNAIRCPIGDYNKRNYIDHCNPHLIDEIIETRPKRIIAFGGVAVEALVGEYLPIMNYVEGWTRIDVDEMSIPVQFAIHPSAVLHNPGIKSMWNRYTLGTFMKPPPDKWYSADDITVDHVTSVSRAVSVLTEAREAKLVAFDTEYNDKTNRLLCLSIATGPNTCFVFPEKVCRNYRFLDALTELFLDESVQKVAHNWKFDAKVMTRAAGMSHEVFLDNQWMDTSTFRKIYSSEQESRLDIAEWMVGLGGHKQKLYNVMGNARTGTAYEKAYDKSPKVVEWYCALDSLACWRLCVLYRNKIRRDGLWAGWTDTLGPIGPVLFDMENTGVKVDVDAMDNLDNHLQYKMEVEMRAIRSSRPVRRLVSSADYLETVEDFNPRSTKHMRDLMFSKEGLALKPKKYTKGGKSGKRNPSTDRITRVAYEKANPVLGRINELARLQKLQSTYVKGWRKRMDDYHVLHTSYRQDVARTGRLSSQNPNLTNIPRGITDEARMLRSILIPHDPERMSLMEVDFGQIELRRAAELSGDQEMIKCYRDRRDIHRRTASMMTGKPEDEITKEERQKGKVPNFGLLYGMSPDGLRDYAKNSYNVSMSKQESKHASASFFRLYNGYKRHQTRVLAQARREGCVYVTWKGEHIRRRWVVDIKSKHPGKRGDAERRALNCDVQGGASEYTLRSLIKLHELHRAGQLPWVAHIVGTVHDSIWFLVWRSYERTAFKAIGAVMTSFGMDNGVPLEVDAKVGDSLGSMEEIGAINELDNPQYPTVPNRMLRFLGIS